MSGCKLLFIVFKTTQPTYKDSRIPLEKCICFIPFLTANFFLAGSTMGVVVTLLHSLQSVRMSK